MRSSAAWPQGRTRSTTFWAIRRRPWPTAPTSIRSGRGLEVLYWHEPLDLLLAPMLGDYREKPFRNVADGELELPPAAEADEAAPEATTPEPEFNSFVGRCVTTLGQRVNEVRASRVLRDSPARLVAADGREAEMQRLYRLMGREYEVPALILELNRNHPLIARLAA